MESSKPAFLLNASDDPIIGQVDRIIDTTALASSVVIDQTEIDLQGKLMEGSRTGGKHDSSDEHLSKNTGSVAHNHNEDKIVPPPSNPKVGDSENDHVAPASELSLSPIDVSMVAVGPILGVSDGQQPQQADSIVSSSVVNGDNDMISPSGSSRVKSSKLTLPLPEVGTIAIGSSQDTDEQKSENAHSASIDSKSNHQITSPNDSTQPHLVAPSSADGSVQDTLDGQQSLGADSLGSSHVPLNGIISSSPKVNDSEAEDAKKGDHVVQVSNLVLHRKRIFSSTVESPKSGSSTTAKEGDLNRGLIDTTSPFESVKEAGSKFGGIVKWKSHRTQTVERRNLLDQDLEKLQEEMVVYKKRSVESEEAKMQVLKELDSTNRQIKELKLILERAQTEENQAKQDSELAMLRAEEMEQGIGDEASVAAKAQLEVAKARHAAAVLKLKSVNEELETLRKEDVSMVTERDIAIEKAEEAVSASKEVEKTVEELTIELMASKESLESGHAAHLGAEEKRIGAALARDQDTRDWEKELKQAEKELQILNQQIHLAKDMKPKVDTASALLLDLKAELAAYIESKLKLENNGHSTDVSQTSEKRTHTDIPAAVASAKKELEEVKLKIEKATAEVDSLKVVAVSLKSELEKEKFALATIKQREGMSVAVASLKDDLDNTGSKIATVQMNEKEARDKMVEVPKQLQQTAQEADEAKSLAQMAREVLSKVKEEAEQAKAGASTLKSRLLAVQKEFEAAKASKKLALAAIKALQDSESAQRTNNVDSPDGVMLSLEEYYDLCNRAYEAEEQANTRVAVAISQIEVAKQSQTRSLEKLVEVNREMAESKEELKIALEKAEKANERKLGVEQELRQWRAEHERRRKAAELSHGGNPPRASFGGTKQLKNVESVPTSPSSTLDSPKAIYGNNTESESSPESTVVKKKKKALFPKIFMFFSRKRSGLSKSKSKKSKTK